MTLRCNPEKSTKGDLSVPRYHGAGLTVTFGTVVLSGCGGLGGVSEEKMQLTQLFALFFLYLFQ